MLEWRVAAKAAEFLKRFEPDFLDDVFHFAFAPRITAGGGKNARRIFFNQRLETGRITGKHGSYQLRFSPFHGVATMPNARRD